MVVYYATNTGKIRRTLLDPTRRDGELQTTYPALTGETSIGVPDDAADDIEALQARLNLVTGKNPGRDVNRCCVIDPVTFEVKRVIRANPSIDSVPDGTLVVNATAGIGWRQRRNGQFERSQAEIQLSIDKLDVRQAHYDSRAYRDAQAAQDDGRTIEAVAIEVAAMEDELVVLEGEKTDRNAPRR